MPKLPTHKPGATPTRSKRSGATISRNGKRVDVASAIAVEQENIALPRGGNSPSNASGPLEVVNAKSGRSARAYIGDCREILKSLPEAQSSSVDLVFADPPFNWARGYDRWNDKLDEHEYLSFTYDWLDLCVQAVRPNGALWVNIPDDWAAEIVCYLKGRGNEPSTGARRVPPAKMMMENWCIWHYRFGQNTTERFINSKVHALYFVKEPPSGEESPKPRTWKPKSVLEVSDRAAIYGDPRTLSKKDGMPAGQRVPMDVWYGKFWGRVQGNNLERRHYHDNQLPEVYLERVILSCTDEGDLVLDPFLGSGTTGVVAHALGRNFIGCEFSEQNARNAVERINRGPVRALGSHTPRSSAIFERRGKGPAGNQEITLTQ